MYTLPLEPQELGRFFEDTDTLFEIDYDTSVERLGSPLAVLTYIANLGMTCALIGNLDNELLIQYMTLKSLTDIKNLQLIHANILYYGKYGRRLFPLDQFDDERTAEFCRVNEDLVMVQMAFVNSTQLYLHCSTFDSTAKTRAQSTKDSFNEIGFSILRLFGLEDFLLIYLAENPPLEDQIYFERYFDEKVFSGAPLLVYFHHPNNMYAGLVMTMANLDEDKLKTLSIDWEAVVDSITPMTSDD